MRDARYSNPPRPWYGDDAVRSYQRSSHSDRTLRGYERDFRRFQAWCESQGFPALPASALTLSRYFAARAVQGRRHATLKREAAALRFFHDQAGVPYPDHVSVARTLRGIARTHGTGRRQAHAALRHHVEAMIGATDRSTYRGCRDAAALALGWHAALRRSELIALDFEDLTIFESSVTVNVCRQPNDPEASEQSRRFPADADPTVCARALVLAWLRKTGIRAGPLFRSVYNDGRVDDARLSDKAVDRMVKRAAKAAGFEEKGFSSQSLRIGWQLQAARDGVPLHAIQQRTGHRDVVTMLDGIRRADARAEMGPSRTSDNRRSWL